HVEHLDLHSFPTRRSSDLYGSLTDRWNVNNRSALRQLWVGSSNFYDSGVARRQFGGCTALTLLDGDRPLFSRAVLGLRRDFHLQDRKSTRLNSSHVSISYA